MSNINKIKIAIVGVGNCASSLVQGIQYYKDKEEKDVVGLAHYNLGGYKISDIAIVLAFDIDRRKVGMTLSRAIFAEPNCTKTICGQYQFDNDINDVTILKGPVFDGIAFHMNNYFQVDKNQKELTKDEIISVLKERNVDIIISYLPVGSQKATEFWADCCLEAKVGFINAIPQFIVSNPEWAEKFKQANVPIIGDDIKSMVGSTIVNRSLVQMIQDRGGKIVNSWQTNFGGNTDFQNMLSQERLESKKISKTQSISSIIKDKNNFIYAGPNGYIECLNDNKISFMRIDFKIFGDISCHLDIKLDVEDSPNSSGIMVDAIRVERLALDRKLGGPILSACAYYCKRPPIQMKDEDARKQVEEFINSDNK